MKALLKYKWTAIFPHAIEIGEFCVDTGCWNGCVSLSVLVTGKMIHNNSLVRSVYYNWPKKIFFYFCNTNVVFT